MDKRYWVGFNMIKGIGAVRIQALLDHFGDLAVAWSAPKDALQVAGLSNNLIDRILEIRNNIDLDAILEKYKNQEISILTWMDEEYPPKLKEIEQPPPVIYIRGKILEQDSWAVSIVGTRRISAYGRQVTDEIASCLATNGVTIVSGLARGVDSIAHESAIKSGGRTLAVLGSGVDNIYPPEHIHLAERIMASGAILSDYPPGTPPDASNFPPRNRIISGLSTATVVVEAGETSGALITAEFAADQGREVFAVPGNVYAPQSKGTNRLISQGARPLLSGRDVLDILNLTKITEQRQVRSALPLDDLEKSILNVLNSGPLHIDDICRQTGNQINRISGALTMLELKGMIHQANGINFLSIRDGQTEYISGNPIELRE